MKFISMKNHSYLQTDIDRYHESQPPRLRKRCTDRAPATWGSNALISVLQFSALLFAALLHTGQSTLLPASDNYESWFQKHADTTLLTQHQGESFSSRNGKAEPDNFKTINLSKCMKLLLLENESPTGRQLVQLHFNVKQAILSHFYKNEGPCRRIIHADSLEMFGQCYEMDIHIGNSEDFKRCKQRNPGTDRDSRMAYKRCVWNVRNVRTTATGPVPENAGEVEVGDTVIVKLYDKPTCSYPHDMGKLVVKAEKDVRKSWRDRLQDLAAKRGQRKPLIPGRNLRPRLPKVPKLPKLHGLWKSRRSGRSGGDGR